MTVLHPGREEESLSAADLESLPEPRGDEPLGIAHRRQLKEIFAALREGREPPVPGEDARKAVEIVLGIYRSAVSGERATFPLEPEAEGRGATAGKGWR